MMKKSRMTIKGGLLEYTEIKGIEKAKGEANLAKLSLLSRLWGGK